MTETIIVAPTTAATSNPTAASSHFAFTVTPWPSDREHVNSEALSRRLGRSAESETDGERDE